MWNFERIQFITWVPFSPYKYFLFITCISINPYENFFWVFLPLYQLPINYLLPFLQLCFSKKIKIFCVIHFKFIVGPFLEEAWFMERLFWVDMWGISKDIFWSATKKFFLLNFSSSKSRSYSMNIQIIYTKLNKFKRKDQRPMETT